MPFSSGGASSMSASDVSKVAADDFADEKRAQIRDLFDKMCLGIIQSLERRVGVMDVKLIDRRPVPRYSINAWEQDNHCMLPDDFKNFLLTSDGMLLRWNVMFRGECIPLGKMQVNPISHIVRIDASTRAAYTDLDEMPTDEDDEILAGGAAGPRGDYGRIRQRRVTTRLDFPAFQLDPCDGNGCVAMVFTKGPQSSPEIWFCDRSSMWYYMSPSFTDYFRLMVAHIGLPGWQYAFTPAGLSPQSKQWFYLYAPLRLAAHQQKSAREAKELTLGDIAAEAARGGDEGDDDFAPSRFDFDKVNKILQENSERRRSKTVQSMRRPQTRAGTSSEGERSLLGSARPQRPPRDPSSGYGAQSSASASTNRTGIVRPQSARAPANASGIAANAAAVATVVTTTPLNRSGSAGALNGSTSGSAARPGSSSVRRI